MRSPTSRPLGDGPGFCSGNSWLTQSKQRLAHPMHKSSAGRAYMHFTLRRLHAQQLRVPLRVFLLFGLHPAPMLLLLEAMARRSEGGKALGRVSRRKLGE